MKKHLVKVIQSQEVWHPHQHNEEAQKKVVIMVVVRVVLVVAPKSLQRRN